jgi:tetratricopeptide (TPR) repeat protein
VKNDFARRAGSFGVAFTGFLYLILTRLVWLEDPVAGLIGLGAAAALGGGWLIWRKRRGARLPSAGLLPVWLLGLLAAAVSTLLSPDPRPALERLAWLAGEALIFYVLLDAFDAGMDRSAALDGALWALGLLAAEACLETAGWYAGWRLLAGPDVAPLFPYRFSSLLGHPNVYMGVINVWAPLALVSLLTARTRPRRFLSMLWLAFYAVSFYFASSRGGALGLAAGLGLLGLLSAVEQPWFATALAWARRRWALVAAAALAGLGGLAYVALHISAGLGSSHPTHAGGGLGARDVFVRIALDIWRDHPWGGIGPGRLAQGWLAHGGSIPPDFWAMHAHNLWLQALAETGPLGLAALLGLLGLGGWRLFAAWRAADAARKPWAAAALAGMATWLTHSLVDEFSLLPVMMAGIAFLAAFVLTEGQTVRRRAVSIAWLLLPLGLLATAGGWSLWAGLPAYRAARAGDAGDRAGAAAGFAESLRLDPAQVFYLAETAVSRAQLWGETGLEADLAQSRALFRALVEREPGFAMWWANLSLLDAQAGALDAALEEIGRAVELAPNAAQFPLQQGWILEQMGRAAEAAAAYQKALVLAPEWRSHAFWASTPLRAQAAGAAALQPVETHWGNARLRLAQGDRAGAERELAFSGLMAENPLARLVTRALLDDDATPALLAVRDEMERPLLAQATFYMVYNHFHDRVGLRLQAVPGFLRMDGDTGQFAALETLYARQAAAGECAEAARTWRVWQQALHAFAPAETPPAPKCP